MTDSKQSNARNPGPSWGYRFLCGCDRVLPEFIFKPLRAAGTWIALAGMGKQRRHSREYLRTIFGREPRTLEVFRHFFAFEESLMLKLRTANGAPHETLLAPGSRHFKEYLQDKKYAFLGTFHVGNSDLLGFLLGPREQHRIFMVRHRVGNSHDTDKLAALVGQWLTFIWVNEPNNMLFALKEAIASGGSVAMKCDRVDFSSKTEAFDFLGAKRIFPFTIYHLALIFGLPVLLSIGVPGENNSTVLHCAPRWTPDPDLSRAANLASAREHFQAFLNVLEGILRTNPYLWFNFMELNPVATAASAAAPSPAPSPRLLRAHS
ncbi:MAG TPA: hypothetical protein VFT72_03615 [Opitutaceae bacterium]|nr:hypothetical protein [Opitutaceae bacterium]